MLFKEIENNPNEETLFKKIQSYRFIRKFSNSPSQTKPQTQTSEIKYIFQEEPDFTKKKNLEIFLEEKYSQFFED